MLLTLIVVPAGATVSPDAPKLVVSIAVDQLRSDYLYALQEHYGEKGFKLFLQEGAVCEEVVYDYPALDCAVSMAAIHTGAIPYNNGIVSETVFDKTARKDVSIFYDAAYMGNGTDDTFSAKALKVSTLSDEVKIVTGGMGRVYSVAVDAPMAIISGGHVPNGVVWVDDKNGNWVSSTYYPDMPPYLSNPYYEHSVRRNIGKQLWKPLLAYDAYKALPYQVATYGFSHVFLSSDKDVYRKFKTSAVANTFVTDVALDIIEAASLGGRDQLDMLNIGYTLAPFSNGTVQQYGLELQDAYVRLDGELSRLFTEIDKTVGLKNTVVFITSTGYFTGEGREASVFKIQSGEFYPTRATSLLNMYLMALYGSGEWVLGFSHNQIYLNRELIKERALDLDEVREKSAQFLVEMEGVQDVHTQQSILLHSANEYTDRLRSGFSPKYSGDLFIDIVPGWEIVYDSNNREYVRHNVIPAPFMVYAHNVQAQRIATPVDVTCIAPTIARILRIRSPNGAASRAIDVLKK